MPDPNPALDAALRPTTALGGASARSVTHGALTLSENSELALASLALLRGAPLPSPFGLALPGPGKWVANETGAAFWAGPDQWILEAPGRAASDFAGEIAALAPGCAVTEQTDGFVAFEIRSAAGDAAIAAVMAKVVNIDVAAFGPGSATRTGMEHMSVFAIRRAPDHLAIIGMRSAAATIWHVLETAVARLA